MTPKMLRPLMFAMPVLILSMSAVVSSAPVSAKTPPQTKQTSYANFYSGSVPNGSNVSPCTDKGCANGLKITWSAQTCYQGDRYSPIALVWTVGGKVATNAWPLTAPCSTGIEFTWDGQNQINFAKWLGASSKEAKESLAICYQYKSECNAGHCVTAGCIPGKVKGVDLFFQAGDAPTGESWLANGKPDGAISPTGSPDSVFWYGTSPPASPYATPGSGASSNKVTMTGRNGSGGPQVKTTTAPSDSNGIDMHWYLAHYEKGSTKGCHQINGHWFSSPPLAFAYTTNGVISSPIIVPSCADELGTVVPFSDINFTWTHTVSGYELSGADPLHYNRSVKSCQGSYQEPGSYPTETIPQPPAGADGIVFTFSHDDYSATCWTNSGTVQKAIDHPGHPRFDVFTG